MRQRFLKHDTKSMIYKRKKNDRLNIIKIKSICSSKDTVKTMKRQVTAWEETFANHVSDKGLPSRM